MQVEFGITYIPPPSVRERSLNEGKQSGSKIGKKVSIPASTSRPSTSAIGIDAESAFVDEETSPSTPSSPNQESVMEQRSVIKEKMRRKSFGANDPEVVTIGEFGGMQTECSYGYFKVVQTMICFDSVFEF